VAAVVGGIVCDAAAQPLHWIYNLQKLDDIVGDKQASLEFWEPSKNPYYCIETGRGTAYADQLLALLESLVESKGYDGGSYMEKLQARMGAGTDYDNDLNSKFVLKSGVKKTYPIQGPWRPKVIKDFLANRDRGLERTGSQASSDMHSVIPVIPLVALYAGHRDMLEKVASALAVVTDTEEGIAVGLAAARILEQFILKPDTDGVAALNTVIAELCNPDRNYPNDLDRAVSGQLREVLARQDRGHREAAKKYFKNS